MAEFNIEINYKQDTGYDQLYPTSPASNITYSNVLSKLTATDTQVAVDELNTLKPNMLLFTNKTIATTDWIASTVIPDYPFQATIPCDGVTVDYTPDVIFDPPYNLAGNDSGIADAVANGVVVYGQAVPDGAVSVATIRCFLKVGG